MSMAEAVLLYAVFSISEQSTVSYHRIESQQTIKSESHTIENWIAFCIYAKTDVYYKTVNLMRINAPVQDFL